MKVVLRAEAVARRASAVWRIETERARLKLRNGNAAITAGHLLGIDLLSAADDHHGHEPFRQLQCRGYRLFEPSRDALLHQQPIHYDVDIVILALIEARRIVELAEITVHAAANVAVARYLLEFLAVLGLPAPQRGPPDPD